ncbi:MAG: SOS response-associated peptidase [Chlorobiales bacterium]|nr:SOS response-associated peptidase [Chlorobiales bacterium]
MCGRFGFFELRYFIEQLRQDGLSFIENKEFDFIPSYNIAPETNIVILLGDRGQYYLTTAHWGIIPHWAKDKPKVRPINARTETLAVKPYFRHMLNRTHCIIPASGFYEWKQATQQKKQPYYIRRKDGNTMAFAGLWDSWQPQDKASPPLISCTIITTASNGEMKSVHDRMPVILEPEHWKQWLEASSPDAEKLLIPAKDGTLDIYPVSTKVNNPKYIQHDCIEPL